MKCIKKDKSTIANMINIGSIIFELHKYFYIKDKRGYTFFSQHELNQIYNISHKLYNDWLLYLENEKTIA